MVSQILQDAINDQINNEFYASYLYLSMSVYCEKRNLSGLAGWLKMQSAEETGHGMKLFDFLMDCDGTVVLKGIAQPPTQFDSILSLFEQACEHEKKVTTLINELYELAIQEKAFAVQTHLQWFVTEQVEEEKTSSDIVAKLKLIGDDVASLLALDRELGSRTSAE